MDELPFPPISKDLLEALEERFPEKSPEKGETERDLIWRGGQRSVVRFLLEQHRQRNENVLTEQVLQNVHAQG
jgi:hypothetical protein